MLLSNGESELLCILPIEIYHVGPTAAAWRWFAWRVTLDIDSHVFRPYLDECADVSFAPLVILRPGRH